MTDPENRFHLLELEIERRLVERFAALRDEFDRLRLESDRRWAGFLDRFTQKFSGIVPQELAQMESAAPAPAAKGSLPAQAARILDEAGNQVEALHRFLELCRGYSSRAALLVARGSGVAVWKAAGFNDHAGSDEAARRVTPPSASGSAVARVLEGHPSELGPDNEISVALAAMDATRAVLIPMVVKEKISGALYADCTEAEEDQFDPESLAFLTFLAGLVVDRLASRKLKPAPSLAEAEKISSASSDLSSLEPSSSQPQPSSFAAAAATAPPSPPEPEFELMEEPEPAPHTATAPAHAPEPEPEPEVESEPEPEQYGTQMLKLPEASAAPKLPPPVPPISEPTLERPRRPTVAPFDRDGESLGDSTTPRAVERAADQWAAEPGESPSSGTKRIPSAMIESAPPPAPPVSPVVPLPPPPSAPRPSTGVGRPSTGVRRLAGPLAPVEGDERRDEARRFAKLLVSEIKLYNEKAVAQGREHGNIYEMLKEDIDRSRQMYDERIPEDVRASSNFFYEELVRTLADGRAEALGI